MHELNQILYIIISLSEMDEKTKDPKTTFVNLLTSAVVAGKLMGLSQEEIQGIFEKVEKPACVVLEKLKEATNESNRSH